MDKQIIELYKDGYTVLQISVKLELDARYVEKVVKNTRR